MFFMLVQFLQTRLTNLTRTHSMESIFSNNLLRSCPSYQARHETPRFQHLIFHQPKKRKGKTWTDQFAHARKKHYSSVEAFDQINRKDYSLLSRRRRLPIRSSSPAEATQQLVLSRECFCFSSVQIIIPHFRKLSPFLCCFSFRRSFYLRTYCLVQTGEIHGVRLKKMGWGKLVKLVC